MKQRRTTYVMLAEEEFRRRQKLQITTKEGRVYKCEEVEDFGYLVTKFKRKPVIREEIRARG